jgi:hypothetical protein
VREVKLVKLGGMAVIRFVCKMRVDGGKGMAEGDTYSSMFEFEIKDSEKSAFFAWMSLDVNTFETVSLDTARGSEGMRLGSSVGYKLYEQQRK